jgi:DNA polymerase III gamma/tau subunit
MATLGFPQCLADKYRPQSISDFCGLEKQKRILARLAACPRGCALLFVGPPGTGKTAMSYAFAAALEAETHHIGSQECRVDVLQELVRMCQYVPLRGGFHVCIVDEADVMSDAAQKFLLSRLDSTESCPNTIWIFTCNSVDRLEERFLSRCIKLEFNSYGSSTEIVDLMARIWQAETGTTETPNLKKLACGNVREALMRLEIELLSV